MNPQEDSRRRRLVELGGAVSDGEAIDWETESSRAPALRARLQRLQQLDRLNRAHRALAGAAESGALPAGAMRPAPFLFDWGPLRVLERIGEGSFGEVYRALEIHLQREVALKLRRLGPTETEGARRFLDEARKLARVRHRNVLAVYGADVQDGRIGFWTEQVRGRTLAERLAADGPLGPEEAALIGTSLCRALAAVHAAGIVHGDVKAANVMRDEDGRILLMDFGAAGTLGDPGAAFGTPLVTAPEILRGAPPSRASDLYSLGVLLFQLVTGRYPVAAESWRELRRKHLEEDRASLRDLRPDLPERFVELVERALAPEAAERFQTAGQMERALLASLRSDVDARGASTRRAGSPGPSPRRIRIPRDTALYGRAGELENLRAAYTDAKAGRGRVVLLEGEAGIGKTRLADELVGTLAHSREEMHFLLGSYPPGGAATTAGAFREAFHDALGDDGLEETLEAHLAAAPLLVRPFISLLRGECGIGGDAALTKDSLHTGFVRLLRALSAERPVIALIDDLHFAPPEGLALFLALARAVPDHRVLLLGSTRPDLSEKWWAGILRSDHVSKLSLHRLAIEDIAQILAERYGSKVLAETLAPDVSRRSDGNPLFLFENLRALEELHHLERRDDGSWTLSSPFHAVPVPSSIRQIIQARVAGVDAEDRHLIECASCLGFDFDPLLVGEALDLDPLPALRRFARIEREHRLIQTADGRTTFDHHLVQEALYDGLFAPLRERYHAALASALEARAIAAGAAPGKIGGTRGVAICEQFLRAGAGREGLRYLPAAMDALESTYANATAAELARGALDLPGLLEGAERVHLLLRRASLLTKMSQMEEAGQVIEEARSCAVAAEDSALLRRVRVQIGSHLYHTAKYEEATEVLRELASDAKTAQDQSTGASAASSLGLVYFDTGRFPESRRCYQEAIALARECGARSIEASAVANLGTLLITLGHYEEAVACFRERIASAREASDRSGEAKATGNLGWALLSLGRFAEARSCFERLLAVSREIGYRLGEHHAFANLGAVLQQLGLYAEALDALDAQLRLCEETGHLQGAPVCHANRGQLFAVMGDFDQARESLSRADALCAETGIRWFEANLSQCWGEVELDSGDAAAAERRFLDALASHRSNGNQEGSAAALVGLAWAKTSMGRIEQARADLQQAIETASNQQSVREIVFARALLSTIGGADVQEAERAFADHATRLSPCDILKLNHLLWTTTGNRSYLDDARRSLNEIREHSPARYRHGLFDRVPLYREIMAGDAAGDG